MAKYKIVMHQSVRGDIEDLAKHDLKRLILAVAPLANEPRPSGCEIISGQGKYRLQQANASIIYAVDESERTVRVVQVCPTGPGNG